MLSLRKNQTDADHNFISEEDGVNYYLETIPTSLIVKKSPQKNMMVGTLLDEGARLP